MTTEQQLQAVLEAMPPLDYGVDTEATAALLLSRPKHELLGALLRTDGCKTAYGRKRMGQTFVDIESPDAITAFLPMYQLVSVSILMSWNSEEGNNWKKAIETAYNLLPKE